MAGFFFGLFIFLTIFCVGLLMINPLKDIEDLVFCSIMSLLAIMFFIDAVIIDVLQHREGVVYDRVFIRYIDNCNVSLHCCNIKPSIQH